MTYKTHVGAGVLFGLIYLQYYNVDNINILSGCILGSVLTDIDDENSMIGKTIPIISKPFNIAAEISKILKIKLLSKMLKHRGITHTLFFPLVLLGLWLIFNHIFIMGLLLGYVSHLIMDLLTVRGEALLYPLCDKKIKIPFYQITTGSTKEKIVYNLVWVINSILIILMILNYFGVDYICVLQRIQLKFAECKKLIV